MIAFTFARRELRGGVRGLRIVIACLALGVAAIAAVGSLREGIGRGLATEGRRLLAATSRSPAARRRCRTRCATGCMPAAPAPATSSRCAR